MKNSPEHQIIQNKNKEQERERLSKCLLEHETPRLILKTLTPDNMSESYLQWLTDPEIVKYTEARHVEHTRETINNFVQDNFESKDNLLMGIFLKESGRHIGNIKLGPVNWRYHRADIGIIIGEKNSWGKGYAAEAIQGMCDLIIKSGIDLQRFQAGSYAGNKGSIKAFQKAGFVQEGLCRKYWSLDGKSEDHVLLGKVMPDPE